jgi:hypothetical protein
MAPRPAHRRHGYDARAAAVRRAAYANPNTRCWQCKRTIAEHGRKWTAGHTVDGDPFCPLLPECESCNYRRGAAMGNARRIGLEPSREW